jgi:hypothetical protein
VIRLAARGDLWHRLAMQSRNSRSGGIFLTIGILAGAISGVAAGAPMKGVLIGTGLGIAAALLVWLLDRRRQSVGRR